MAFQAAVGTWFAVHILVRQPMGGRFGINNDALATTIELETGDGLDDIKVSQSDGGSILVQCKTRPDLGSGAKAPLAKTIHQLVRWIADAKRNSAAPDLTRNVAVLSVRADAPRTLDDLETGCRALDLGGTWSSTRNQRNKAEQGALLTFEKIVTREWTLHSGAAPQEDDLRDLARIFRIARFSMDEGDGDWREASQLLGRHLYGGEASGEAPLRDLKNIVRSLIASGAPADRAGLLRALRLLKHQDVGAPRFEADLAKLRTVTIAELSRLAAHSQLPLGAGIPLARESDAPLLKAIEEGSLLVVGEPGAGKTGALVNVTRLINSAGDVAIFLSVDKYPGVAILADLALELGLENSVVDTLGAMPGAGRKVLIIDALDACRGGASEGVFAALVEEVRRRLEQEWTVVASIRTFDLKNGRRFRQAFGGTPADAAYVESSLNGVRHFLVPRLSEADLALAGAAAPELTALLASAPPPLTILLGNIFNLSLAAQLLTDGTSPQAFREIQTQSGLIDAYEDVRLDATVLQQAAAMAASVMVSRRQISIRKIAVKHAELDAVIQRGVLAESGDLVSFAHHVLFDHITGRFHLEWDNPDALIAQLAGDTSTALMLAPALRFAIDKLWHLDITGRPLTWRLIAGIFSTSSVDPVLGTVALRIFVENITDENDLVGLAERLSTSSSDPILAKVLPRLTRFAAIDIQAARTSPPRTELAWAKLAESLALSGERALADSARVLLQVLFDHGDITDAALLGVYGRASRALLELAWKCSPPLTILSASAIRYVGWSYASNPAASRILLNRILREPHFSQYADREATWLAEQIIPITHADPEFTVVIYAAFYSQTISDVSTSWLGGQPSRILPLSSSRRQEYEHCHWQLGTAMGKVLAITAEYGTRALIDALIGKLATKGYGGSDEVQVVNLGAATIELRGYGVEFNAWDEQEPAAGNREADLLSHYVHFLRGCDIDNFAASVGAASREYATGSVWTRIFGVGSERVTEAGQILWPLVERPDFFKNRGTLRDAVRFVAAAWPSRSPDARVRFETMVLDQMRLSTGEDLARWCRMLGRILKLVPEELLETQEIRTLRGSLETQGLLIENYPIFRSTTSWNNVDDFVLDELRRAGIDMDSGSNREIKDASDALRARVQQTSSDSSEAVLLALWNTAVALLKKIDATPDLHEQVRRPSWGNISEAVERVASSAKYAPGANGLPELEVMFEMLERLSASPYPQPPETKE